MAASNSWKDFKKSFPWRAMVIGLLVPKGMLLGGISLNAIFPGAMMAIAWCLTIFLIDHLRKRKANIFAILALVMIFLRVVVILMSRNPVFYLFAQALDSALYGLIFLISALFPCSIVQLFAEASGMVVPDAIRNSCYYGRAWCIISVAWGVAFLLMALLLAVLNIGSMKLVAVVDMLVSWPLMIVMMAFTVIFPKWYWTKKIGEAHARQVGF